MPWPRRCSSSSRADGSDFSWIGFPDGGGLSGNELVDIVFDEPITAVAADFPGGAKFELIADGVAFFTSPGLGGSGPDHFAGLISARPFNRVRIWDWVDDDVYIDDLHFGPPIPAPGALSLLLGYAASVGRRRRRGAPNDPCTNGSGVPCID